MTAATFSEIVGYHLSYPASLVCIAAILIPLYVWMRWAR